MRQGTKPKTGAVPCRLFVFNMKNSKPKPATQRRTKARPDKSDAIEEKLMAADDRLGVLQRVLSFGPFLGSSFEPTISDREIIVCFADIRGFTAYCRQLQLQMQDRRIQNFLKSFFKIFSEGLLEWFVDNNEAGIGQAQLGCKHLQQFVVPTMYKNLGDGLMMVWEIPPDLDMVYQGVLGNSVIQIVDNIVDRFYQRFRDLTADDRTYYGSEVTNLNLGVGLAKGHAWRLDFRHSIDYAGSVVNLASRLQGMARPSGIVIQYDMAPNRFDEIAASGLGQIASSDGLREFGPHVKVMVIQRHGGPNHSLGRPAQPR